MEHTTTADTDALLAYVDALIERQQAALSAQLNDMEQ